MLVWIYPRNYARIKDDFGICMDISSELFKVGMIYP